MSLGELIRKGYSDGPFGQTHWRMMGEQSGKPDLYCLHPAPFSGLAYTKIMPLLAGDRRVIAPDYPGYGGSDPFKEHPTIAEYATAMFELVDDLTGDEPIDLTGFHTGNLVAGEMAISAPNRIRRLALVDVPAFDAETRAKYRAMAAQPFEISDDKACLDKPWKRGITSRIEEQGSSNGPWKCSPNSCALAGTCTPPLMPPSHTMRMTECHGSPTLVWYWAHNQTCWKQHAGPAQIFQKPKWLSGLDIVKGVLDQNADKTTAEILSFLDGKDQ